MEFEKGRDSNSFCHADPSWACAYAPKMEEACEGKNPDGDGKPSGCRGFPGGTPGRLFFRHFFATRQRNGILAFTERAKLCEAGYEVVKTLAKLLKNPLSTPCKTKKFPL